MLKQPLFRIVASINSAPNNLQMKYFCYTVNTSIEIQYTAVVYCKNTYRYIVNTYNIWSNSIWSNTCMCNGR